MKAKDLIKILQAVDPESVVRFEIGKNESDLYIHAQAILESKTSFMPFVARSAEVEENEEVEGSYEVTIRLWECLWKGGLGLRGYAEAFENKNPLYKIEY